MQRFKAVFSFVSQWAVIRTREKNLAMEKKGRDGVCSRRVFKAASFACALFFYFLFLASISFSSIENK